MQHRYAIERKTLAHVLEDLGDDLVDVFLQLTELFLSDTPRLLDALQSAISRRDFEEAQRVAHRLKGGCAQIGALALANDAELIEHSCHRPDPVDLDRLILAMQTDWPALADELNALRNLAREGDAKTFLNTMGAP